MTKIIRKVLFTSSPRKLVHRDFSGQEMMGSGMRTGGAGSLLTVAAPVIILSSCHRFSNLVIISVYSKEFLFALTILTVFGCSFNLGFGIGS